MIEETYKGYIVRAKGEVNESEYTIYTDKYNGVEGKWKMLRGMTNLPNCEKAMQKAKNYIDNFETQLLNRSNNVSKVKEKS